MHLHSEKIILLTTAFLWNFQLAVLQTYDVERLIPDIINGLFTSRAVGELGKAGCNATKHFRLNSDSPTVNNIFFQLRTRCNTVAYSMSHATMLSMLPEFDPINRKTVIFVTGWNASPNEQYVKEMEMAYHCRGGYNFMVVDASRFLQAINYGEAAQNVVRIGRAIANGIINLKVDARNIHLIGHSLGAHVVGSAGHFFTKRTRQRLYRITGLDPAKPCFDNIRQINVNDAAFVDIIHSNPHVLAIGLPIGHIDFYPIGLSSTHPNCESPINMCSHNLAITYYSKTVHPGHEHEFMTAKCDSELNLFLHYCNGREIPMGFVDNRNERGTFLSVMESKNPSNVQVDIKCGLCTQIQNYDYEYY